MLKAFSAVGFNFPHTRGKKSVQDTLIFSIAPKNRRFWQPRKGRKRGVIYLADNRKGPHDHRILGNAINSLNADLDMARDWIRFCKAHHKGYCRSNASSAAHTISGFKLIDCETHKVIGSLETHQYVALSYVWGKNALRTSTRLFPNPAPRVIEDAIAVTKRIGFRYLWVDRYCINQNSESEQHGQIARMDEIYAGAEVTIVAAAGDGPEYGLPGVSKAHRGLQPSAIVGNYHFVSSLRPPRDVVMSSKWASRAWTFQEAVLSRRALFFTDEQMFFECASMSCQETIQMPLSAVHQTWNSTMGRECDRMRIFPPNGPARVATDIIERIREYTSRSLSYPADNLNALSGIFNSFANEELRRTPQLNHRTITAPNTAQIQHLWGIPILPRTAVDNDEPEDNSLHRRFCLTLGWQCASPTTRCPDFPSWSWAGWELSSTVKFPINLENGKIHLFNNRPQLEIWLYLRDQGKISLEDFETQPNYNEIFKTASQFLLLKCITLSVRFERTGNQKYPLEASIKYKSEKAGRAPKTKCRLRFSPNINLTTEQELERFTERKWKAIILSSGLVFQRITLLVVKKAGFTYERVGLLRGTYGEARFKKVTQEIIALQ